MNFLDVYTDNVTNSGNRTAGTADGWQSWGTQADTALREAATAVAESTVTTAVETYGADWNPRIQSVAAQVDALGRNTAGASNVVNNSDGTSAVFLTTQGGQQQSSGSLLTRPIEA